MCPLVVLHDVRSADRKLSVSTSRLSCPRLVAVVHIEEIFDPAFGLLHRLFLRHWLLVKTDVPELLILLLDLLRAQLARVVLLLAIVLEVQKIFVA